MTDSASNTILGKVGLKLTKLYLILILGGIPTAAYLGAIKLSPISLNELGDFLAGAFGPLAIFWLILGFFQQGQELKNSVETLKLQANELARSVEQQRELVLVSREAIEVERDSILSLQKERENSRLPQFAISFFAATKIGAENFRYKMTIANTGATVSDAVVTLTIADSTILRRNVSIFKKDEELQYSDIEFKVRERISSEIMVSIEYMTSAKENYTESTSLRPPNKEKWGQRFEKQLSTGAVKKPA